MKGPLTYTLRQPIVLETRGPDGELSEEVLKPAGATIPLRRPKAKDLRVIDRYDGQPIAMTLALIERISPLDNIEIDNLDAEDLTELGESLAGFMPSGQKTGQTA